MASRGLLKKLLGSEFGGVSIAGQPTSLTHPKLVAPGQLTPGILASEYGERRQALVDSLPQNSIAIIGAAPGQFMAGNIPYPYRQDASFSYLTGINQPGVVALLGTDDSSILGYTLFVREPSSHDATWTGNRINKRAALEVFGADEAYDMRKMSEVLQRSVRSAKRVFLDLNKGVAPSENDIFGTGGGPDRKTEYHSLKPFTHDLRSLSSHSVDIGAAILAVDQESQLYVDLYSIDKVYANSDEGRWRKSEAELDLMRQSAECAAQSIRRCMELSSPGVSEHKLAATFEYRCKMNGASNLAYPTVAAGGSSATIIHYGENNKVRKESWPPSKLEEAVQAGELLLMDAGCERHGYASDVTRTWPVSGRFTSEQRAVYDVVYEIYRQCLQRCRLGYSLRDVHQHSIQLASEGIVDLGLARGKPPSRIAQQDYREFYPHSVGHWLGMDTHDAPLQGLDRLLQPNAVMTLEPGLYIPDDPKYGNFAGIGIRLEDDIAIKQSGPEVLSSAVPLDPAEIESLVGTADVYSRVAVL